MQNILPWKHPTTTLILDDSRSFLDSLELILHKRNRRFLFATDPNEALEIINNSIKSTEQTFPCLRVNGELQPDYAKIPGISNRETRSYDISTLIIDYYMPAIDGLELCKKIKNDSIQKILLTASSDENIAIEAFNSGIIQQYFRKQDQDMDEKLNLSIEQAENRYFTNKASAILSQTKLNNDFFSNQNLQKFLTYFIQNEDVIEYYIFDKNGSLFCVHKNGSTSQIFIKSRDEINIPLTWLQADYLPKNMINSIKECSKMLCIPIECINLPNANAWEQYLYSTIQIPNEPDYFIAAVKTGSNINKAINTAAIFLDDLKK